MRPKPDWSHWVPPDLDGINIHFCAKPPDSESVFQCATAGKAANEFKSVGSIYTRGRCLRAQSPALNVDSMASVCMGSFTGILLAKGIKSQPAG